MDIILCAGANGRAVIFGRVDSAPVAGQPVTLRDARMILYWAGPSGLFGVASKGPETGSRLTAAVPSTTATVWREWVEVTPGAAVAIRAWRAA